MDDQSEASPNVKYSNQVEAKVKRKQLYFEKSVKPESLKRHNLLPSIDDS